MVMNIPADEITAPISLHLKELRASLIKIILVVAAGFGLSLCFYHDIFAFISQPLHSIPSATFSDGLQRQEIRLERFVNRGVEPILFVLPPNTRLVSSIHNNDITPNGYRLLPGDFLDIETLKPVRELTIFSPTEGILSIFRVCFWVALVLTSPLWMYFCMQFIIPALHRKEKRLLIPFLALSALFCAAGIVFSYFVTLPLSNALLWSINADLGSNLWSLANYFDYTFFLLLANALAFEISLILFFLVHLGVISSAQMSSHRRHAIVAALILAAVLTPPDIPSQLMLAVPIIGLYELAILYAWVREGIARN